MTDDVLLEPDPDLRDWRLAEAGRLLDWAAGSVHPAGGFGWRLRDGSLDLDRGRPLWLGCRMVHCLSLGHLLGPALRPVLGRPSDGDLAAAGVRALREQYRDHEHGGWWADADRPGEGRKEAYGHAFVVLAGSTATIAGVPGAEDLLADALATIDRHFWDAEEQMPVESWDAAFTEPEDYRGGNAAMHLVEALLAAGDATGDQEWARRALAVGRRMADQAAARQWRMPEHFDTRWQVVEDYNAEDPRHPFRPYGVTPGHAFEWARLLLGVRAVLPEADDLLEPARRLAEQAWTDAWDDASDDGGDPGTGGLLYTTAPDGRPVVTERFHWVACEAVAAAWALAGATGDPRWAERYSTLWQHVRDLFVDADRPGAWWHELSSENRPVERTWVGAPDTYHALQAVLLPSTDLAVGLPRSLAAGLRPAKAP